MSRDPWGGDPYHYGTWVSLSGYGWAWVPGTVWAPAWVTWSYSDRYVGWAPLPPSFACGESGYSGRPVVVSQTQYIFVPSNLFVDTDVASVWVSPQENATIFRQTRPVTQFAVSEGIVRNTGIPTEAIAHAAGGRIETHSISSANTTPHAVTEGSGGRSRQLSVVAPAHEVNAAVAARPQEASHAAPSSGAPMGGRTQAGHESMSARPESRPESIAPPATGKPQHREPRTSNVQEAPPAQSHGQAPPPAQSHGQAPQSAPAAGQGQQPRAEGAQGHPAPPPPAQAAPPKQEPGHEKAAKKEGEKENKKEGEKEKKKDENH